MKNLTHSIPGVFLWSCLGLPNITNMTRHSTFHDMKATIQFIQPKICHGLGLNRKMVTFGISINHSGQFLTKHPKLLGTFSRLQEKPVY